VRYRPLGKTGLRVSEVGYGAWGVGKGMWVGADDEESLRSLRSARDAGVNFFDTALVYGDGHSEQLIAKCFGDTKEVIVATKVPPQDFVWGVKPGTPLRQVFPREYVFQSLEQSLRNLGRDSVDIYQFHTWLDDWASDPEWQETARELKSSGKVRFVGISVQNHQPGNVLKALDTGLVDTVQVIYNVFDQSPEDKLFSYAQKNRIGIIVRVPFDEGSLTGAIRPDTEFPEGDFRNNYFAGERKRHVWERVEAMIGDIDIDVSQLPEIALRFCLSHPAVSTVIAGMRKPKHVASNIEASNFGPLPEEMMDKLRKHRWDRPDYWD
jgi:aryl-alcohol dehydrogenase-like predicted oxidoreductase